MSNYYCKVVTVVEVSEEYTPEEKADVVMDAFDELGLQVERAKHEGPARGVYGFIDEYVEDVPDQYVSRMEQALEDDDPHRLEHQVYNVLGEMDDDGTFRYVQEELDDDDGPDGGQDGPDGDGNGGSGVPYDVPDEVDVNHQFGDVPWDDLVDAIRGDGGDGDGNGDGEDEDDYEPVTLDISYAFRPDDLENLPEDEDFPDDAGMSYAVRAEGDEKDYIDELTVRIGRVESGRSWYASLDDDTVVEETYDVADLTTDSNVRFTQFRDFDEYADLEEGERYQIEVRGSGTNDEGEDIGVVPETAMTDYLGEHEFDRGDGDELEDAPDIELDVNWEDDMDYATGNNRLVNALDALLAGDGWIDRATGVWNQLKDDSTDVDKWYGAHFTGEDVDDLENFNFVLEAVPGVEYGDGMFFPDRGQRVQDGPVPVNEYMETAPGAGDDRGETYIDAADSPVGDDGRIYQEPIDVESLVRQIADPDLDDDDGDNNAVGLHFKVVDDDGDVVRNRAGDRLEDWTTYDIEVFDGWEALEDADLDEWVPDMGTTGIYETYFADDDGADP